jgi:hypothetical protein
VLALDPSDFGVEKSVSVQGVDSSAVLTKLQELIKAGEAMPKYVSYWLG